MTLRWHVCNSLTGKIVGSLRPHTWEITEPLDNPSTGTLTVALPTNTRKLERMLDLIPPRIRSIVLEDEQGRFLFGGPIPPPGAKLTSGNVEIPVVDWRSWFYRAPLRPTAANARQDYIKGATNQREQCLIMTDLAKLALTGTGRPKMVVDDAPTSGILRQFTTKMFQRSIGEALDDVQNRERGAEWSTYITASDDEMTLLPHFKVWWPEQRSSTAPLVLAWRLGRRGNTTIDYEWPTGEDVPTKVWAVDGTEDVQLWTSAASPAIAAGSDLLWEQVINLNEGTGTVTKAYAFEQALGTLDKASRLSGLVEFTVNSNRYAPGDLMVGDRARITIEDGLRTVNIKAARIVQRVLSGGRGQPEQQKLSVDLADIRYPDDGTIPGKPAGVV